MIGKISGTLDSILTGQVIVDVNGVGYIVAVSPQTLGKLGQIGDPVSLFIDTHVREDAFNLFGFADAAEQEWFRLLTSVQGVGAKAAFAILGVCAVDKLGFAIAAQDKAALTQADGVGPKLATRILSELKDKVAKMQTQGDMAPAKVAASAAATAQTAASDATGFTAPSSFDQDALSALVNLGYGRSDAFAAIQAVHQKAQNDNDGQDTITLQDLIKRALKELAS